MSRPAGQLASPSTFLRMSLIQQLRRRKARIVCIEAATGTEAVNSFAGGRIDLAIVDNALMKPARERG
jgi:hypothetical protein